MVLVSVVVPTYNRKRKLARLLKSLLKSDCPSLEIVVVDDASTDGTVEEIENLPKVKVIRNEKELFLAASRNIGIRESKGDYVFLIDDDNVVSKDTISTLVDTLQKHESIGIVAPITYYFREPARIWCCGIKINMISSFTQIIGRDEIDIGQYDKLVESDGFPNAFMIKREVFKEIGFFDEKNFPIHYDEADFGERVKKKFRIFCEPKAKIWHDIGLPNVEDKARLLHCHTTMRAYYCSRNRIIFLKRHSKPWQFFFFLSLFSIPLTIYYLRIIFASKELFTQKLKMSSSYIRGVSDGLIGSNRGLAY